MWRNGSERLWCIICFIPWIPNSCIPPAQNALLFRVVVVAWIFDFCDYREFPRISHWILWVMWNYSHTKLRYAVQCDGNLLAFIIFVGNPQSAPNIQVDKILFHFHSETDQLDPDCKKDLVLINCVYVYVFIIPHNIWTVFTFPIEPC